MTAKKEPSAKLLDKHAKFLAAWAAAGYPDKFELEGTSLNKYSPHPCLRGLQVYVARVENAEGNRQVPLII